MIMTPGVLKFTVTLPTECIKKYNEWKSKLPLNIDYAVCYWLPSHYGEDILIRAYLDKETDTVIVYDSITTSSEIISALMLSNLIIKTPDAGDILIATTHEIVMRAENNELIYDGMDYHFKLLNTVLGTNFKTSY